jgi:NAD(P)-dependent dehydrogenase (short-subunit alcohol dehydrogenase family)
VESIAGGTAFVTGAASGIGLAISEALIASGARVVVADRDRQRLELEVARLGPGAIPVTLDVTDREGWAAARDRVEIAAGGIDILVNNAGLPPDWNELVDMPFDHFDRLIDVMLTGVFNGISTFGRSMRSAGRGHIVNIASLSGLVAGPRVGAYTAAKFGVIGMSEVLRAEMEPHGVGVSVVCPGSVETNINATSPAPTGAARQRTIPPHEVADEVVAAIRENRFFVLTHPEYRAAVARRGEQVLAAFDRAVVDSPDTRG